MLKQRGEYASRNVVFEWGLFRGGVCFSCSGNKGAVSYWALLMPEAFVLYEKIVDALARIVPILSEMKFTVEESRALIKAQEELLKIQEAKQKKEPDRE